MTKEEKIKLIQDLMDDGYSQNKACEKADVKESTYRYWRDKGRGSAMNTDELLNMFNNISEKITQDSVDYNTSHTEASSSKLGTMVSEDKVKVTKRVLIIPDCHIPYHNKKAYALMLEVAKDINPEEIVILGDYADFYAVNGHGKAADMQHTLNEEVEEVKYHLNELRELFPEAKIVYIEGNHENRLARYIDKNARSLHGLMSTKNLLNLDSLNIDFVPYDPRQQYSVGGSKLYARHEPAGSGKYSAAATVNHFCASVIFGHVHAIQEYQFITGFGEIHRGIGCGWLGDEHHRVMNYVKKQPQWSLGFAIVDIMEDRNFFCNVAQIINNSCSVDGKIYKI